MKKPWIVFLAVSRTALLSAAGILIVLGLFTWRLSSLTPGLSESEIATYESAASVSSIVDNMVNAPYKTAVFISTRIFNNAFGLRLVGALAGTLSVIVFYLLSRRIFKHNIALASTAMFASSSLLLGLSRTATALVMMLSLLAVVGCGFYIRFSKRPEIIWLIAAVVLGLSLYVPGMIIFIAAAAIWQFNRAKNTFERLETPFIVASSVIFGILCAPFIVSLVRDPGLWRAYLGLPAELATVIDMLKQAGTAAISLFAFSPVDVRYWLGRQPILDIFASAMFVLGIYSLVKQHKLDRLWTIGGILLLGLLWVGVTANHYGILIMLPFIYLVIGSGMQLLANQWFSVFPRNPIARYVGSALMAAAVIASVNFQTHRYFVAWPNNDSTKGAFAHQFPNN